MFAISAHAKAEEPRTASLAWTRGEGASTCADVRALAVAVDTRLGREVFVSPARAELFVDGQISRTPTAWHVSVTMRDVNGASLGSREFDEPQAECGAVTQSITLVLSLMIDPEAEARVAAAEAGAATGVVAATAEVQPVPAAIAVTEPTPPVPCVVTSPTAEPPVTTFNMAIGAVASLGVTPSTSFGPALRFGIDVPHIPRIQLEARMLPSVHIDSTTEQSVSLSQTTALLAMCPQLVGADRIALRACGGVEAGVLNTTGEGFDHNGNSHRPLVNAILRADVGVRLVGHLTLGASLTAGVAITRHTILGQDATDAVFPIYRTAPVVGSAELLLGLDFF